MKEKTVLETYEEKREWVREFNLTSDLFAGKVFEDIDACQELCRILSRVLWSVSDILRYTRKELTLCVR